VTVNGADLSGQNFTATATGLTVSGVVVDDYGTPLSDVPVIIAGISGAQTTDINGKFTFNNVTPPYQISMLVQDNTGYNYIYVFQGATAAAPILPAFDFGQDNWQATVAATVIGASDSYYYAVLGSPDVGGDSEVSAPLPTPWNVTIPWTGPSSLAGNLYVLAGAAGHDCPA